MGNVFSTQDVNTISTYLSHPQIRTLSSHSPVDCLVLCASSLLSTAETVFAALHKRPDLAKTVVLCGGIGHSTPYLYEAIAQHPRYKCLARKAVDLKGVPEARVLEMMWAVWRRDVAGDHALDGYGFGTMGGVGKGAVSVLSTRRCRVLIEDISTNCGANAQCTRRLLQRCGGGLSPPETFVVVQDPTLCRRTVASFEMAYRDLPARSARSMSLSSASSSGKDSKGSKDSEGGQLQQEQAFRPLFRACPTFVPRVRLVERKVCFDIAGLSDEDLWSTERFLDLVVGEVPRLRDDAGGYGPKGQGYIAHVDIPEDVERAFKRLRKATSTKRQLI